MLSDILNSGATPALELSLRFAGQRQRRIAHNIANISTPNFRHNDVPPAAFQQLLSRAVDDRRRESGGTSGELKWVPTQELRRDSAGQLHLTPRTSEGGVLAHDRNSRNLERLMQDHAENAAVYRMTAELLRTRYQHIREAIAQRV
jgi:flagellar basal-body rod protein FlgB